MPMSRRMMIQRWYKHLATVMLLAVILLSLTEVTDATRYPTRRPTTKRPTTMKPSKLPTVAPTKKPTTMKPSKRPTTAPTKKPTTHSPSKPTTQPPTASSATGCSGAPCDSVTYCRSEYGYCGGNALSGVPDAWCNVKSTWKAAGCTLGETSTNSPVAQSTSAPSTSSPTSLRPTTSSPTSLRPTTKSPTPADATKSPTQQQTKSPTNAPTTKSPTQQQTKSPTNAPTTKSPTQQQTKSPTNAPVPPATKSPTTASSGTRCTGEPCSITTHCRSQWGYCGGDVNGSGDDYCNGLSMWKSTGCGGTAPPAVPTLPPGSTSSPTVPTTKSPTVTSTSVADVVHTKQSQLSSQLLISETPQSTWVPSTVYKVTDLETALRSAIAGFAGLSFIGMNNEGKLNLAAFLAQSMKETIRYDVCDENSWDLVNGVYPASNACGQLGQSYQDYTCSAAEKHMECLLDSTMEATALTNAKWYGASPPLSAGPNSKTGMNTPGWDSSASCGASCNVYPGQQGGAWKSDKAYASSGGRTDTENCVWWGRGVIQVTGRCNFGKVNYFLGKAAKDRGITTALYPDIDFCKEPSAVCKSTKYPDLKWITSFYYWMRDVQEYNSGGWNFRTELAALAQQHSDTNKRKTFINAISGIVNRGAHTIFADGQAERASNFEKAYTILFA